MSATAAAIIIGIALTAAAVIGFYVGRHTAPGKRRVDSLQEELEQSRRQMADYRESVNRHFEKTANLFTNMAGSYRDLYDHLRESYGTLTDTPGRPLLPERAGALLEAGRPAVATDTSEERSPERRHEPPAEVGVPPPGMPEADDEHMMGDAPHIPAHAELEEAPEEPIKARRDEEKAATADDETGGEAGASTDKTEEPPSKSEPPPRTDASRTAPSGDESRPV
jgi:uncharacterized protein